MMLDAPEAFAGYEDRGETEFMQVFAHPNDRLLVALRKQGAPLPPQDVVRAHEELLSFAPQRQHHSLIIDLRGVSGNNDARFEAAIREVNGLLLAHFVRVGLLVRSHIGKLHATRLSAVDERMMIASDPAKLLERLLG